MGSAEEFNMLTQQSNLPITFDDFLKVDMCVGRIISVEDFPEARKPAYKLKIDFGPELGIKKSCAQVTKLYKEEDLVNRLVIAVVNFPTKQIGPAVSEVPVLGTEVEKDVVALLDPGTNAVLGARVF
jgi:tRNA-binding protein